MTDSEILDLFHHGSSRERAFKLLVEKYQQKIYWHIRRMVTEHENANDVMQNTFVKIWKGLENFRSDSQLFTWRPKGRMLEHLVDGKVLRWDLQGTVGATVRTLWD